MSYKLTFLESARKEWNKLSPQIKSDFKKKLIARLQNPIVPKDKLSGLKDCYKIKLRTVGYRLVYKVFQGRLIVQISAVGKRDKDIVYNLARGRTE